MELWDHCTVKFLKLKFNIWQYFLKKHVLKSIVSINFNFVGTVMLKIKGRGLCFHTLLLRCLFGLNYIHNFKWKKLTFKAVCPRENHEAALRMRRNRIVFFNCGEIALMHSQTDPCSLGLSVLRNGPCSGILALSLRFFASNHFTTFVF